MAQIDVIRTYSKKKCLVIDDFPSMRTSVMRMLKQFGAEEVETAASGEEAVSKASFTRFDIILSDFNMGDNKNGQQILEELKFLNILKNTALFVLITAETARFKVVGTIEHQPDGYIAKPFTPKVLQKRLDKMLMKKEELFPINHALDKKEYNKALDLCNKEIEGGTKFEGWCKRTKVRILYELEKFDDAEKLLQSVLEERELDWALLELGKVYYMLERYNDADEKFEYLIQKNENYLVAYDWLAKSREKQGDTARSQELLQKALEISPTSVLRQEKLGKICQKNNDTEGAEKAFRSVIRHSNNSVHDKPDNYYALARHLTSSVKDDPESKEGKRAAEEAQKALERVGKKFKRDDNVKLQTTLMEVNLLKSQNKDQEAMAKSVEAHKIMNEIEEYDNNTMTPELGLERAKMELVKGNADVAANLLTFIADEHCDNLALMNEVDTLFGHDALKASKEKTVAINKEGITYYQQKKYDKAIATFTEALKLSPNHVGLNLNLIQALIENAKGQDETHRQTAKARCEAQLKKLSHIHDNHRQHERYKNLIKKTELLCA